MTQEPLFHESIEDALRAAVAAMGGYKMLRAARQAGYHGAMAFIDADCGYAPPQPIEPEDERAQLQRAFADSVRVQAARAGRSSRLNG